uniref:Uncharacterized protein n=1 Tax=Leersia perrieri TaxID=77586 RepID=A0A0D9WSB3_9ORYZ
MRLADRISARILRRRRRRSDKLTRTRSSMPPDWLTAVHKSRRGARPQEVKSCAVHPINLQPIQ